MRKLIWVGLAGSALLVVGVCTTALLAARYPNSFAGWWLPIRVVKVDHPPAPAVVVGVPDDPVPVGESATPAQIVIPEDDASASGGPTAFEHLLTPCAKGNEEGRGVSVAHTAPTVMPYTDEDGAGHKVGGEKSVVVTTSFTVEPERMPYADECEKLHMPCFVEEVQPAAGVEEEQEEQADVTDAPSTGAAGKLIRSLEQMMKRSTVPDAAPTAPACQEDPNYHQHYSGCPYNGHSTCPNRGCPGSGAESHSRSVIQKIRSYKFRETAEEPAPTEVDTAEMRPEDHKLNENGQGKF
ncbi:MAG: hypothetical protein U0736_18930 [Gemmataceae bacterium]